MSIIWTPIMHCDKCGIAAGAGGIGDERSLRELMEFARQEGWKFPIRNRKRTHLCGECAREVKPIYPKD